MSDIGENRRDGSDRRNEHCRRAGHDRRLERRGQTKRRFDSDRRDESRHPHNPDGQRRGTDRPGDTARRTVERRAGSKRRTSG